jgi:bla regulator protein BlaR1
MGEFFPYAYVFFNWIIETSVIGSILIALLLISRKLLRNKLGVKFQYAVWFILILRLIMPQLPQSSISVFNVLPSVRQMPPLIVVNKSVSEESSILSKVTINDKYDQSNLKKSLATMEFTYKAEKIPYSLSFSSIIAFIWLCVVVLISFYVLIVDIRFWRKIKKHSNLCNKEALDILEQYKQKMKIKRNIALVQTSDIKNPALIGLRRPVILLPANIFDIISTDNLKFIFVHELAHLKRGDILINWIISILKILHWFNPIVLYGLKKMGEDMEVSCDSLALNYINSDETREYGYTIISLMEHFSRSAQLPGMASIIKNKSEAKRRIVMIKLFNRKSYKLSALAIAVLLVVGGITLTDAKALTLKDKVSKVVKIEDKINYPFISDSQIIGKWQTVDFVREINDFNPDKKTFKESEFIKELNFAADGQVSKTVFTWTKDLILDPVEKTASRYFIKELEGSTYLFFEWKSGDYTLRHEKPQYYVMKKISDTPSLTVNMFGKEVGERKVDKVDYPFVNDPDVIGKWESVDFIDKIDAFHPETPNWQGDLYLKNLTFLDGGKVDGYKVTWTKGLVISKENQTASKYTIKNIDGSTYMFFEWKNGDYMFRGMDLQYYVLKKVN